MNVERFQAALLASIEPAWRDTVQQLMTDAERRRPMAAYNTGTISEAACLYLMALTRVIPKAKLSAEIGTFIGTSATVMSLNIERVYTCDKSNDCFPGTARIVCNPFTRSKRMLAELLRIGASVDFFFFDGRIRDLAEIQLILALSKSTTVYAFDDYEGGEKGVLNVNKLLPHLPVGSHFLVPPPAEVLGLDSKTTIAALVPGDWL